MAYNGMSLQYAGMPAATMADTHELDWPLSSLPRANTMEVQNDPRFMSDSVISKRLAAFQTISVVAVLMVNLSIKQMFDLEKGIKDFRTFQGMVQLVGFVLLTLCFLMNLTTVVIVTQQLFMTYRLLTVGPNGFEVAQSYYLNPNIVTMRHFAVKGFFFSLPVFVLSTSCMVYVAFAKASHYRVELPVVFLVAFSAVMLWAASKTHSSIFKKNYAIAKAHEAPLLSVSETEVSSTARGRFGFFGLDV